MHALYMNLMVFLHCIAFEGKIFFSMTSGTFKSNCMAIHLNLTSDISNIVFSLCFAFFVSLVLILPLFQLGVAFMPFWWQDLVIDQRKVMPGLCPCCFASPLQTGCQLHPSVATAGSFPVQPPLSHPSQPANRNRKNFDFYLLFVWLIICRSHFSTRECNSWMAKGGKPVACDLGSPTSQLRWILGLWGSIWCWRLPAAPLQGMAYVGKLDWHAKTAR